MEPERPGSPTSAVLLDIRIERARQSDRWSIAHDDEHALDDWTWLIGQRVAALEIHAGDRQGPEPKDDARRLLVEIAAIAVAGIEALDRLTVQAHRDAETARE